MKILKCKGFKAGGVSAGIKATGDKDLGIIYSETPADTAGVFTKNLVQAACVTYNQDQLKKGTCRAIIANSGNANCYTGVQGETDNKTMAEAAASALDIPADSVLAASTGVIGEPLPVDNISRAVPPLAASLSSEGFKDFSEAIMTTDKMPKVVSIQGKIGGQSYTVTGTAKGSGMIKPDMATMLCFICTDLKADSNILQEALNASVNQSFNRITVDGDTSTNDMVILMANGQSEAAIQSPEDKTAFQAILDNVCLDLAKMIVKDGEGATKLVKITVKGAETDGDAYAVADTVAESSLVKTAFFGEDANWGRIIAAAGRAKVKMIPEKTDLYFNNILMVNQGTGCGKTAEAKATEVLKKSEFEVIIDLNIGKGTSYVYTCDFSIDYVKINADYRT